MGILNFIFGIDQEEIKLRVEEEDAAARRAVANSMTMSWVEREYKALKDKEQQKKQERDAKLADLCRQAPEIMERIKGIAEPTGEDNTLLNEVGVAITHVHDASKDAEERRRLRRMHRVLSEMSIAIHRNVNAGAIAEGRWSFPPLCMHIRPSLDYYERHGYSGTED